MENINGALAFQASLDINDFNVSADAMEQHVRRVSSNVQAEAADMEASLMDFAQRGAMYIQAYLVGQGMTGLLQSIMQVRGQFQQLEIAFGTMLGSESQAKSLMDQMIQTAAKTPFDLMGVASGAKQLLAYGEAADRVNDTLVRLGNIASGLSIPLNDIVYLYGTTMVQGRLYAQDVRQFTGRGIPLVKELAKMYGVTADEINNMVSAGKIGFADVEKVLNSMTNEGGQFYNLMEKQSASLTGMISNLEDSWDSMLNDIGTANQDVFADAISGASYLVEHYQTILDILKSVTLAYGSYKAAIVLNTLATKGYTGVALIDNTCRQAKIALMKAEAVATGQVAAQTKAMQAAQEAHVAALESEMTAEELATLKKQLRIATIQSLLTEQQAEYLSNLGLTASSEGYEAAAMQVLNVEQQQAVKKVDLTSKSAIYRAALEQEVNAKRLDAQAARDQAQADMEAMRIEVQASAKRMESAKQAAVVAMQKTEAARYELWMTRQGGDAAAIATAQKKLEGAQDNQALAHKAALAASSDHYAKKKALEVAATRQATVASVADTTAKGVQTTATNILSAATAKATLALKTLWATMKANPIGWLVSIVGLAVSAFMLFKDKEDEVTDAMGEFQDTTKKEIDQLNLLFAILANTEKGTKTHKDAIEKVNAVCKEYNKTLLDENATLDEQKLKYAELAKAIQETTAEKIKAKYIEQALQEYMDQSQDTFDKFISHLSHAQYNTGRTRTITNHETGDTYEAPIMADSEHIQGMTKDVQDAIRSMVEENAKIIAEADGDTTEQYHKTIDEILNATKAATGATDAEINGFRHNVESYLNSQIDKARELDETVKATDERLSKFFAPKDPTPQVESVNLVELTFDDLKGRIEANEKEIDNLNAKIIDPKTDPTQIDDLKTRLNECIRLRNELNGAVQTKSANLNTDAGIQERIKALREENQQLEYGSEKRKQNADEIARLQAKMKANDLTPTGGRGANSTENTVKAASEKQLEAQRKLEEARISVMEEGYAKRKAVLDYQHKQALAQIDKEEKELEAARRKAGRGGLTDADHAVFQERRALETQTYDTESTKLFDGEIDYKKRQYEAYFQWVRNVGRDVADAHFRTLIDEGTSFTEWINQQVAALEAKKATNPETFTDGDANALNALKMQQNEINGTKSAMDLFKESVSRAVNEAQSLAEKLEAVARLKERLANGEFHLNQDETAAASLQLENNESDLQRQAYDQFLKDYQGYEEQKTSIRKQYALLRAQAEKQGNADALAEINRKEKEAISKLASDSYVRKNIDKLLKNVEGLTTTSINAIIDKIKSGEAELVADMTDDDIAALLKKLEDLKTQIKAKNPFEALSTAVKEFNRDSSQGNLQAVMSAGNSLAQNFKVISDCMRDIAEQTGNEKLAQAADIVDDVVGNFQAAEQGAEAWGGWWGAIIGGVTDLIPKIIKWANGDNKLTKKISDVQREINELSRAYDRLSYAYNNTYWSFNDGEREEYERTVQALNNKIASFEQMKKEMKDSDTAVAHATMMIQKYRSELEELEAANDMRGLYEAQIKNLEEQKAKIQQQIEYEEEKKNTDSDQVNSWKGDIDEIDRQISDLQRDMQDTFAGTSVQSAIDDFANAIVDAYAKGEDAAEALGKKTKEVLKNAVVEALKRQFLAKGINDAVAGLAASMSDNILTDKERKEFEDAVNAAGSLFTTALDSVKDLIMDVDDTGVDALTGAVRSMSEETGGLVAGRLNAVVINQGEQVAMLRQLLLYQAAIEANTGATASELREIKAMVNRIANSDNPLLSQGIS